MYMVIAVFFILVITSLLVYGSYYECEHFEGNHAKKKRKILKRKRVKSHH